MAADRQFYRDSTTKAVYVAVIPGTGDVYLAKAKRPQPPTGFSVSVYQVTDRLNNALATWSVPPLTDYCTSHKIYRAVGSNINFRNTKPVANVSTSNWQDTTVIGGNTYTYYLAAENAMGDSTPSGPINITIPAAPIPLTLLRMRKRHHNSQIRATIQ